MFFRFMCDLHRSARSPYAREDPAGEFRRLGVHLRNIPAEPDKPRQEPGGTSKKVSQNLPKIWSGRVPRARRIGPGPFWNTPERTKRQKIQNVWSKNTPGVSQGRFFGNFGARPGAQNQRKTSPGPKKCVRRGRRKRFVPFFLASAVRSRPPDRFLESLALQNCAPTTVGARF